MWPYMLGMPNFYSHMRLPDIYTPTGCPHQKRSRSHCGDHTQPKGKVSKHRKFIKKMARV